MLRNFWARIPQRRTQTLSALLIFAILATALLHRALLPNYTLLPLDLIQTIAPWDHLDLGPLANPLISEPFSAFYPFRYLQTTEIGSGQLPLWNPYILTGSPVIADPLFQPFYPPNLIAAVFLPVQHALPWLAWGHLVLTGWFMYGFLRQHRLHWLADVLGGGVWMLSASLVVWLENPVWLSTLTWLPGIFWAYQKAFDEQRLEYAAVGGLLVGLAVLGGQVQFIFAAGLALGVYALSKVIWIRYERDQWSPRPLYPFFVIGIIGLGIGAVLLLPAGAFAVFSERIRYTPESIMDTRFPWQHFVTLIAPDFYGNPVNTGSEWGRFFNYAELAIYFGVVALLLALTAPFVTRRRHFMFTAIILTILVLAIVLGTFLVRMLFLFPGSQFVTLTRFLFLIPMCGSWMAAIGLDGWLVASKERRKTIVPILMLLAALAVITLWSLEVTPDTHAEPYADLARSSLFLLIAATLIFAMHRRPWIVGSLLVLVVFVELLQWGWDFNPITSTDNLYPDNQVVAYLQEDPALYRVLPLQSEQPIFGPNVLSVYGIETVGGYSSMIPRDFRELYSAISKNAEVDWLRSSRNVLATSAFKPASGMLNAKYILSPKPLPANDIVQVEQLDCDSVITLDDEWKTQSFTATEPGLNRIDILLATHKSVGDEAVDFRLWRDDIGGDLVAEAQVTASPTDNPSSHPIYFRPVADSADQPFVWGIKSDESVAACAVGPDDSLAFIAFGTQLISRGQVDDIWIYENPNALPRVYLVHHAELVTDERLLERATDPDFNFYHSVLVTVPLPPEQKEQLTVQPIRPEGQVEVEDYDLHSIDLKVSTSRPSILVLADANYPGWEATINETRQEIFEVNGMFRGLFVPAGEHSVSFTYRPTLLYWGIGLAGLSIALTMAIIYAQRKSKSSDKPFMVWAGKIQLRQAHFMWLLFIAGGLVMFWREPLFFLEPRLWAEEGTTYFATAYNRSPELWHNGFLAIHQGYLALWPNIAAVLAVNLIPVEHVPLITTSMAFLVQLIPLAIIIWGGTEFWGSPLKKVTGVLIVLLTPISGELWLNTINSQFYLALVTFLILLEPAENGAIRKWSYRFLLALACLTGPVSGILAPLYIFMAFLSRERERAIQAAILAVGVVIQVLLLVSPSTGSTGVRIAGWQMGPLVFSMWTQSIGLLLGGLEWAKEWGSNILVRYENGSSDLTLYWIGLLIGTTLLFGWLTFRMPRRYRLVFLSSYGLILVFSYLGSLGTSKVELIASGAGHRYFWVPNVIFGFMLMANIFDEISSKLRKWLCTILLIILLVYGGTSYRQTTIASWEWPQWRTEITLWQADPEHKVEIWPPGWEIQLREHE